MGAFSSSIRERKISERHFFPVLWWTGSAATSMGSGGRGRLKLQIPPNIDGGPTTPRRRYGIRGVNTLSRLRCPIVVAVFVCPYFPLLYCVPFCPVLVPVRTSTSVPECGYMCLQALHSICVPCCQCFFLVQYVHPPFLVPVEVANTQFAGCALPLCVLNILVHAFVDVCGCTCVPVPCP